MFGGSVNGNYSQNNSDNGTNNFSNGFGGSNTVMMNNNYNSNYTSQTTQNIMPQSMPNYYQHKLDNSIQYYQEIKDIPINLAKVKAVPPVLPPPVEALQNSNENNDNNNNNNMDERIEDDIDMDMKPMINNNDNIQLINELKEILQKDEFTEINEIETNIIARLNKNIDNENCGVMHILIKSFIDGKYINNLHYFKKLFHLLYNNGFNTDYYSKNENNNKTCKEILNDYSSNVNNSTIITIIDNILAL